jgi:DNA primase
MPAWIDFKLLRSQLSFEDVLHFYQVEVKKKKNGTQHMGFCPLPDHKGKRNSVSFSANLEKGIFQCFGCGAKGNLLEFAALMDGVDPQNGEAFKGVALKLQKQFGISTQKPENKAVEREHVQTRTEKNLSVIVNTPLDFELKGLDQNHPYLLGRGFTPETIEHFGLGFSTRGMMKDRVAIPLHDDEGKLVGYAGRVVDDFTITEENPRYRFPGDREREGTLFQFRKSLFLYNGFRIVAPLDDLIVTESFTAVWWVWQNGMPNIVATMGADCSERQAELILSLVKPGGRVWILTDGDNAGTRLAHSLLTQISPHRFTRWVKLDEGKQPTDLSVGQLKKCFMV